MTMQESTTPRVDVGVLLAEPTQFTARRIRVAGVLLRDESESAASVSLLLCDDKNRAIPVTAWQPSENDREQVAPRTAPTDTVSEFLGRPVVLFGTWCQREGRYLLCVEWGYVVDGRQRLFTPGEYVILSGSIERRTPMGIGGEAPPAGNWLTLSRPIHIGRLRTDSVFLDAHQPYPQGYSGRFHGRLSKGYFGGVERPRTPYAVLTGVSNLRAGEPIYDGQQFLSAVDGRPLRSLVLEPEQLAVDAPSTVVVLEPERQMAHIGTIGGFLPPEQSQFHGFDAQVPLGEATDADRLAILFNEQDEAVSAATGEPLRVLAHEGPDEPYPDALYTVFLYDDETRTVYEVISGGLAGFRNRIEHVVYVPELTHQITRQTGFAQAS
jgi:hypothetical protein